MKSAYVEKKDFQNLHTGFTLKFGARFLHVFVWKSEHGLRDNTCFPNRRNVVGAYVAYPYRVKRSGLFGEVHLVEGEIGAGYVAHELQHFIFDWSLTQAMTSGLNERQARLAGEITRDFWNQYTKRRSRAVIFPP